MPKHRTGILLLTCLSVALAFTLSAATVQAATFKTVDVPNASETDLNAVNNANTAVGDYIDLSGVNHGFALIGGTRIKSFDVPGSLGTFARGINDSNQVVGWYVDSNGVQHGYVFSSNKFTTLDPPNTILTNAWGINNAGVIVGTYVDANDGAFHGFVFKNGNYTI